MTTQDASLNVEVELLKQGFRTHAQEISALSDGLKKLSGDLSSFASDIKSSLAASQAMYRQAQDRPLTWQHITFGVGLVVTLAGYFSWWSAITLSPTRERVEVIERRLERSNVELMRYQMDEMRKMLDVLQKK